LTVDADGRSGRRCGTTGRSSDDHEGTVRRTIEFSMRNVTSLTFAGPAFTTAFVTTAAQGSDEVRDRRRAVPARTGRRGDRRVPLKDVGVRTVRPGRR
jgi:sugar lactone lactonase YvrE